MSADKNKKPWDLPPAEPRGDDRADLICIHVGISLSNFEKMLSLLPGLFATLVGCESLALARAFGTLESVPNKVRMAKYAAAVTLSEHASLLKRTDSLLSEIERFSQRRNDIAHGYIILVADLGHYLVPGEHATTKFDLTASGPWEWWSYRLTSGQINAFSREFERLMQDISELNIELRAALARNL